MPAPSMFERLDQAGIQPSMSRPACPWDNAMAESFMRTLKKEEVDGRCYRDQADAEASIGQFIEDIYNRQRLHSALDYLSPLAFETRRAGAALAASGKRGSGNRYDDGIPVCLISCLEGWGKVHKCPQKTRMGRECSYRGRLPRSVRTELPPMRAGLRAICVFCGHLHAFALSFACLPRQTPAAHRESRRSVSHGIFNGFSSRGLSAASGSHGPMPETTSIMAQRIAMAVCM